ncbi:MAG: hypothetical protein ABUT20_65635, partial [Bacteroidota bacterium]
ADSTVVAEIKSPYPVSYSSRFAMDDPKNAETLLSIWKDWDNGDLVAGKDKFADSVTLSMADGSTMHGARDSILAEMQKFRSTFAKVVSEVNAITALKSTDKNENWALIWGKETDTDKKGKEVSFYLQETWRFNKEGKANLVYQFKATPPPPPKK